MGTLLAQGQWTGTVGPGSYGFDLNVYGTIAGMEYATVLGKGDAEGVTLSVSDAGPLIASGTPVPEPAALTVFGVLPALALLRRRR
jgi:hypothetical protein